MATKLSNDLTKPQPTAAGDAPADTTDPKERASSAKSDKAAAAKAGHQSVNAVTPVDPVPEPEAPAEGGRTETYTAYDATGAAVEVTHNLDTGETTVAGAADEEEPAAG